jgi:hypothetical protein
VWKSGFDSTDIVKCDGEFFLKYSLPKSIKREYIKISISQFLENHHSSRKIMLGGGIDINEKKCAADHSYIVALISNVHDSMCE